MVLVQKEIKKVYLGNTQVRPVWPINFATQWPCPDGFHVPLTSEWTTVYNSWVTVWAWTSSNWTNFSTYLKLPMAWLRSYQTSNLMYYNWSSAEWFYWSSSPYTSSWYTDRAYSIEFYSWWIFYNNIFYPRWHWFPIRAFKNEASIPDSSWTTLKAWSWSAWIFRNQTEWLISISSDWTTRTTMQDKNLWATSVYSSWNATAATAWNIFQWGNNNAFSWSWSVSTSTTQVNTNWYWPWNYYSGSSFIYWNDNIDWSSIRNDNLRWWVDGNVPV